MNRIEVARASELHPGASTEGIIRNKAFETEEIAIGRSRIAGGVISGWHHHGSCHLYGFIVSGKLQFDYGKKGSEFVELGPGDYFHIPVGLVHRDVNPDQSKEAVVVSILVGGGPAVVNVTEPV